MSSYFDRLENKMVDRLPKSIDLGRYYSVDGGLDVTNRQSDAQNNVSQELLNENEIALQSFFRDIDVQSKNAEGNFDISPIIQQVKNKLDLNDFENLLETKLFHLEEICQSPCFLLDRIVEKVNVSRARRIPNKSYLYLASHTEDWLSKSIIGFKPGKILNEELEVNYDVYENWLLVSFIGRCLKYLRSRIRENSDIMEFIKKYEELLKRRDDKSGWYEKINRNFDLLGSVYQDDNYSGNNTSDSNKISKIQERLKSMEKRLMKMQNSDLFAEVDMRMTKTVIFRNSNVMVNHKHYRYLGILWMKIDGVVGKKSEEEMQNEEQDVLNGMRTYAWVLIAYVLKQYLHYELKGSYDNFRASHESFCDIELSVSAGIASMKFGKYKTRIVVLGNRSQEGEEYLKNGNLVIFYFDKSRKNGSDRYISINPYDVDSAERVGRFIMKYIVANYINVIKGNKYEYDPSLYKYIDFIKTENLVRWKDREYSFCGFGGRKNVITFDESTFAENFGKKVKDKSKINKIKENLQNLSNTMNENMYAYGNSCYCIKQKKHHLGDVPNTDYIKCEECGFVVRSKDNKIFFGKEDSLISDEDWGMDRLSFDLNDV
jgi:DNA-directed RNA polymerase subunit M/transcription elongation factor TFIIS